MVAGASRGSRPWKPKLRSRHRRLTSNHRPVGGRTEMDRLRGSRAALQGDSASARVGVVQTHRLGIAAQKNGGLQRLRHFPVLRGVRLVGRLLLGRGLPVACRQLRAHVLSARNRATFISSTFLKFRNFYPLRSAIYVCRRERVKVRFFSWYKYHPSSMVIAEVALKICAGCRHRPTVDLPDQRWRGT